MSKSNTKRRPLIWMPKLLQEEHPEDIALLTRDEQLGRWIGTSRGDLGVSIERTAEALIEFGIEPLERVGVFSENMDRFLISDLAILSIRGIMVPFYATSSLEQVKYMITDAGLRLIFVGEQLQYNTVMKAKQELGLEEGLQVVIYDRSVSRYPTDQASIYFDDFIKLGNNPINEVKVELRRVESLPSDTALIMYTSGTSGTSKGVEIARRSIDAAIDIHLELLPKLKYGNINMSFLPLTHIFEKMWAFVCLKAGVKIAINQHPKEILRNLMEVRPHYMCNVPRFWEKVYVGIYEKVQGFSPLLRRVVNHCINVSRHYHFDYRVKSKKAPLLLRLQYQLYSHTLLNLVKKKVGIERGIYFPVAGAALSDKVHAFLVSIGVPLVYGYGLTETTASVSFCRPTGYHFGSIGRVLPILQVRTTPLNEEQRTEGIGEIEVKGDTVMKGYFNRPEENERAFTSDGWFRTGDVGRVDKEGNIFFVERAKDLFKTANGKYIAPQMIENLVTTDPLIEQAVVIAEERSFVSALIYPDWELVRNTLEDKELTYIQQASIEQLAQDSAVYNLIETHLSALQTGLASYETIKKFVLLTQPLTIDNGLLTNSLKTKRYAVEKQYADAIEAMYQYNTMPNLTQKK